MEWKFKDGELIYYRLGMSVYPGVIEYTDHLPAITEDGEECYYIADRQDKHIHTCACSVYRKKEDAVKDALAEIHRTYWPWLQQYFSAILSLGSSQ